MSDALVVQLQADIASFKQGMEAAVASLAKVQESAKRTSSATKGMQQSFAGAALAVKAFVVAKAVEYINELKNSFITLAEAPIKFRGAMAALTGSTEQAADALRNVYDIAAKTGTTFADTANVMQKMTLGLKDMGATQPQIAAVTETLLKMGSVAGNSGAETAAVALQISQALGSGRLQGDELRSVFERMPDAVRAVADQMGVSVGEVRKLASEGKITSDIFANAILNATKRVNEQFEKMPLTLERAKNNIQTALTKAFDQPEIAKLLQSMAERIQSWVPVINSVARSFRLLMDDIASINKTVEGASGGVVSFGKVLEAVFRVTGIALVIDLLKHYDQLRIVLTQQIPAALLQLQSAWQGVMAATLGVVGAGLDKVKGLYADTLNTIINGFNRIREFTGATPFAQITVETSNATKAAEEFAAKSQESARAAAQAFQDAGDAMAAARLAQQIRDAGAAATSTDAPVQQFKTTVTGAGDAAKGAAKAVKEVKDELQAFAEQLKDKLDPMREFNRTLDQIKAAFDAGYLSVEQYRAALKMLLEEQGKAKESTDKTTESVTEFAAHAGNMFFDAIASGKDFGDVMKQLAMDLAKAIFQMMVMKPLLEAISNGMKGMGGGGGGGLGGILGSIIGGIFGKSAPMTFDNAIPAPGGRIGTYAQPSVVMQTDPLGTNSQNNKEVNVVVNNYTDSSVSARRQDNGDLEIIVEKVKRSITSDFLRGGNNVASAVERAYGLQRGGAL